MVGPFEECEKPSGSIKCGEFLDQLNTRITQFPMYTVLDKYKQLKYSRFLKGASRFFSQE